MGSPKKWLAAGPVLVILAIATMFGTRHFYWHLFHGDIAAFHGYNLRVPKYWFVKGEAHRTMFFEGVDHSDPPQKAHAELSLLKPATLEDLEEWESQEIRTLKEHGAKRVSTHKLEFDGRRATCVVAGYGDEDRDAPADAVAVVQCNSEAEIKFEFNGGTRALPDFYALISSMHKTK